MSNDRKYLKMLDELSDHVTNVFLPMSNGFEYILTLNTEVLPEKVDSTYEEKTRQVVNWSVILESALVLESEKEKVAKLLESDKDKGKIENILGLDSNEVYILQLSLKASKFLSDFLKEDEITDKFSIVRSGSGFKTAYTFTRV